MRFAKLFALTISAVALSGCGGDDDPTGPGTSNGPVRTLTVSVSGVTLTAGIISGAWSNGQFALSGIFGTGSEARSLNISANNFPTTGTYQLGPGNPSTAIATWVDGNTGIYSSLGIGGSGTLTLTKAEVGHMTGTFTFTAATQSGSGGQVLTVTVTSGQFEIKLQ